MVERSAAMAFAPGAFVFPGGRVDTGDRELAAQPGDAEEAAKVAAIRETIEETGIALALTPAPSLDKAARLRRPLLAGEAFATLLHDHALELSPSVLTPFARWSPGPEVSRRFDTRFFIAAAPDAAEPHVIAGECVSARWTTAVQMLEDAARGFVRLIFPTRKNLERLAPLDSFSAIVEHARTHPVEAITPQVQAGYITIPEGLGYPITRDPIEEVRRG
ncbi:MAG: NUDIX hydrolase [Sphingomicrobium sp.]